MQTLNTKSQNINNLLQNRNFIIVSLFLLALIFKFLIFFLVTDPIIFYKYPYFAQSIVQGKDIGERMLDISPFYLFVNILSYYIYGTNWEALVIVQVIIASLNSVLVFLIGEKFFGRPVGILAALLLIFYANLTIIDLTIEPESILIFINSLSILMLIKAGESNLNKYKYLLWFAAGCLIGLSVITKPNSLLFFAGVLIWVWLTGENYEQKWKSAILLLVGVTIFVTPVTVRNYLKFDDFILTTADGGKVFYHGNGPGANGMGRSDLPFQGFIEEKKNDPDAAHAMFRETARAISGYPLKPSQCASFWFDRTWDYIKSDPSQWFSLELRKFYLFWNKYEVHDIDSNYKNYVTLTKMPLINFGVISVLGILGMLLSVKSFRETFLLYWMIFSYLVTTLVFFASSRYRIPAAPFFAVFAAYTIAYLFDLLKKKKIKKTGIMLSALVAIGLLTNIPYREEIARYDRWQEATRVHYSLGASIFFKKGMYEKAIAELNKTIALEPDFVPAYNMLGKSYALLNNLKQAEINFRQVIRLAPELEEGYLNLGLLYRLKGDEPQAKYYLRKALSVNPDNEKIKKYLGD
jgi:tetratricopeptide (TPR) repeat protein